MTDIIDTATRAHPALEQHEWWQTGVVYQIYPRSFQDSNADGIGDLNGIRARLDHLVELGVDAVWISPIYPSPMADFGYDVSDYRGIDPTFGTLAEFDELIGAVHERGLKLILDFVPSHSSDQHPWFVESRASRDSDKRDWYVWADPATDGGPPSNWISEFGGSTWTWDAGTEQYYLHIFLAEQPSLNWRNPAVREAMHDVLRFWFDRGVDGFRVDAVLFLVVDEQFRDNPINPDWQPGESPPRMHRMLHTAHQPETFAAIREMRSLADTYDPPRVMIAESCSTLVELESYYGHDLAGFHLPFNFELLTIDWQPTRIADFIDAYEAAIPPGAWPNWVCGNHDVSRVASRRGEDQARIAAMLLLTLRGTPTIYQGEEIGMVDVPISPEAVVDPWEKQVPGIGLGRDPVRTPIPWHAGASGGFTDGTPWLPLGDDHADVNVDAQRRDPDSMLQLHRRLIALRRAHPALAIGAYRRIAADARMFVFERTIGVERLVTALNFSDEPVELPMVPIGARVLAGTHPARPRRPADPARLAANEGLLFIV